MMGGSETVRGDAEGAASGPGMCCKASGLKAGAWMWARILKPSTSKYHSAPNRWWLLYFGGCGNNLLSVCGTLTLERGTKAGMTQRSRPPVIPCDSGRRPLIRGRAPAAGAGSEGTASRAPLGEGRPRGPLGGHHGQPKKKPITGKKEDGGLTNPLPPLIR